MSAFVLLEKWRSAIHLEGMRFFATRDELKEHIQKENPNRVAKVRAGGRTYGFTGQELEDYCLQKAWRDWFVYEVFPDRDPRRLNAKERRDLGLA